MYAFEVFLKQKIQKKLPLLLSIQRFSDINYFQLLYLKHTNNIITYRYKNQLMLYFQYLLFIIIFTFM